MPSKRYRLKMPHPYAKAGTIVELVSVYSDRKGYAPIDMEGGMLVVIPLAGESTWLEEVKEEVTFTKEQADAIQRRLNIMVGMNAMESSQWYNETASWLIKHTSKEH